MASITCNKIGGTYKLVYFILHTFLLVTMLLLIIAIICYYCIKHRLQQNHITILLL